MPPDETDTQQSPAPDSGGDTKNGSPEIELEDLAEKIYILLLRELEIEGQRMGNY